MGTGAIRLFRFAGIEVFLHYSWFLVAAIFMTDYVRRYESPVWGVLEYISVFVIVLIHEFGHALACRQVGGVANRIVLWPLGGIAFVNPPRRPGAYLWSIAAGPLVNVILLPVLAFVSLMAQASMPGSDVAIFCRHLNFINALLLGFNLLPVFPLDGGQIAQTLMVASDPWGGLTRSLWLSVITGAITAVVGGIAFQSIFMVMLFGSLAYSSYLALQQVGGGGRGRPW